MIRVWVTGLFLCFFCGKIAAQRADLGTWNIVQARHKINNRWGVFGEAQLRSLRLYNHFHYYEYKGGVEYWAHPNIRVALAAGSYQTYREGGDFVRPKNNDEFRIWPQITLTQPLGRWKIEQRYRAEFRFTSNGFRQRFRQRISAVYAFGPKQKWQISGSNELFFTNREPYFERNRVALNLTYKFNNRVSAMLGYLHQFDYKINDETGRDFLQTGVYFDL